jgi:hypothetical protein
LKLENQNISIQLESQINEHTRILQMNEDDKNKELNQNQQVIQQLIEEINQIKPQLITLQTNYEKVGRIFTFKML